MDDPRRKKNQYDWLIRLVLGWGANLLALWLASRWIESVRYRDFTALAIAAGVLAVVNLVVKPLLTIVSCLLIIATLGVALFFVNMAMVALTAWLVPGFGVGGFWSVAGTTLIVWAANVLVQTAVERVEKRRKKRAPWQ